MTSHSYIIIVQDTTNITTSSTVTRSPRRWLVCSIGGARNGWSTSSIVTRSPRRWLVCSISGARNKWSTRSPRWWLVSGIGDARNICDTSSTGPQDDDWCIVFVVPEVDEGPGGGGNTRPPVTADWERVKGRPVSETGLVLTDFFEGRPLGIS